MTIARALSPTLALSLTCLALGACDKGDATASPEAAPAEPAETTETQPETEPVEEIPASPRVERAPIEPSEAAKAIVAADDRSESDRKIDERRYPAELLTWLDLKPGMKVADLGAGSGYSSELMARAVGKKGKVWAQNPAEWVEEFLKEKWPARLKTKANKNVVKVVAPFEAPLPPEATGLDLVFFGFAYHDVVAAGDDVEALNADVFNHLKPGGVYVVLDHHAAPMSGPETAADLHRLSRDLVVAEIEEVGFELVEESDFLRDPEDDLMSVSHEVGFITDRYALKFRKPA